MDDIRRPRQQPVPPRQTEVQPRPAAERPMAEEPQQLPSQEEVLRPRSTGIAPKRPSRKKWITGILLAIVLLIGATATGAYVWYQDQLKPIQTSDSTRIRVTIESGDTFEVIGQKLVKHGLVKSTTGFELYTRLTKTSGLLQAGVYSLSKSMSLPDIVEHMTKGKTDTMRITLFPGGVLKDSSDKPIEQKTDVTSVLLEAGYSSEEIATALAKKYDHPVLATKPPAADLEGYIYGETYEFQSDASVEDIIKRALDELYKVVVEQKLEAAYKKQGLTLYEGITLASIVQREIGVEADQKKVAAVFINRLGADMNLGSDVTYQYIADKTGVARDPTLESPYNTRVVDGLPPGPIAAPGKSALIAVAYPAKHDYLFFLSGDDDVTYFAKTENEHQRNIDNHCQKKCEIL